MDVRDQARTFCAPALNAQEVLRRDNEISFPSRMLRFVHFAHMSRGCRLGKHRRLVFVWAYLQWGCVGHSPNRVWFAACVFRIAQLISRWYSIRSIPGKHLLGCQATWPEFYAPFNS